MQRTSGHACLGWRAPSLPAAPLLAAFARAAKETSITKLLGGARTADNRAFYVARRSGQVTIPAADRLANRVGLHPAEIWGEQWWDAP